MFMILATRVLNKSQDMATFRKLKEGSLSEAGYILFI